MRKKYIEPTIEIMLIDYADTICTSGDDVDEEEGQFIPEEEDGNENFHDF